MRLKIVIFSIILCAIFLLKISAKTEDVLDNNGYDWNQMGLEYKLGYCAGFVSATVVFTNNLKILDQYADTVTKEGKSLRAIYEYFGRSYELYGVSVGQLVAGLNDIYSDYKNMRILLHKSIYIAYARSTGTDEKTIEKELQWLRNNPEGQICDLWEYVKRNK